MLSRTSLPTIPPMVLRMGVGLALLASAVACSKEPPNQWMKSGAYTSEDFRRDVAECTRDDRLDEPCLESRGWFTVKNPERPAERKAPTYNPSQTKAPPRY